MHFDIIVPSSLQNPTSVCEFGLKYLKKKEILIKEFSSKESTLCHIERASKEVETEILKEGYFIIEMENCN